MQSIHPFLTLCGLALAGSLLMTPHAAHAETTSVLSVVATKIAVGDYHTCALTTAGGVQCWGYNIFGQLGNGLKTNSSTPVAVSTLVSGVAAISGGGYHTCALTTTGGVKCWGQNNQGQLGNGSTKDSATPVTVSTLASGVAAIAAGGDSTCALTTTGGVKCWGNNGSGQLGNGLAGTDSSTPVAVSGLASGVAAIASGSSHVCALTTAGGLKCWGRNFYGQLGNGLTTDKSTWVAVNTLASGVAEVTGGGNHTCARTTAGAVQCWGYNYNGQLGDGSKTNATTPVAASTLGSGVKAIDAGSSHTCAVTATGGAKCWGSNLFGQLGNGLTTGSTTPVAVSTLGSGVKAIEAGSAHTCALTTAGGVQCWGLNSNGQLGNGLTTESHVPVAVSGFDGDVIFANGFDG